MLYFAPSFPSVLILFSFSVYVFFSRYVVVSAKFPEGFCLWPSKYSFSWNSVDVGPKRDIIGNWVCYWIKSNFPKRDIIGTYGYATDVSQIFRKELSLVTGYATE